ncbi:thioesterase II family protein [Streptomyces sp. H27-H5]|uniref:thioesterase II family protein n=1 Tax=Streptomyces sp. H27-H5 TaxID=2996460 RepID=UPI00226F3E11|nr:alpha/beta fold hydrolase [Streptomyces sp. H27-H5]MCY0957243.1 alpha/beta fold hydrolase [Streptomyces sp. H27-H5]
MTTPPSAPVFFDRWTGSPWLRRFHPGPPSGPAPTLVFLPHAGGSAAYYHPFSAALAPCAEVLVAQYPGRQERIGEPVPGNIAAMADGLLEALMPWRERPLVLFGHSMGALIGYEVTRRLEHAGTPARGLIVSGRRSPLIERSEGVHPQDDDALIALVSELAGTDARLLADPDFRELILPALRGDYRAVETHRHVPGPVLRTPVSVLTGESDPRVGVPEAMAWREVTAGAFTFRGFPGGHFYLNEQRDAVSRAIAEDLAAFTARAGRSAPTG